MSLVMQCRCFILFKLEILGGGGGRGLQRGPFAKRDFRYANLCLCKIRELFYNYIIITSVVVDLLFCLCICNSGMIMADNY